MLHKCKSCNYESAYRANVRRHEKRKHQPKTVSNENEWKEGKDMQLFKDSIEIFKLYQLLQRMKKKTKID